MKAVILAGGTGTRIMEESALKPKPMIEIGGRPILCLRHEDVLTFDISDFVVCCGYKSYVIKDYFGGSSGYVFSDVTFDIAQNKVQIHQNDAEPWKVTLVDTGMETMTGGRLKRVRKYLNDDVFCLTYGDGVADVNLRDLVAFHECQKTLATVTAVRPAGRFGALVTEGTKVVNFYEKPEGSGWINGGFFVLSPQVLDYIEGDRTVWENEPLERLAREGQLSSYSHEGYWHPMDTLRDKNQLEALWSSGKAPWKVW